ncbi:hypothetical protein PENTCL1PPCAC_30306, partial [Pristionchus entomophagus]
FKGNLKSFYVGGVVGRRICKEISETNYFFYLECLEEFKVNGDASVLIYAGEPHSFKKEDTQYKV